MKNICFILGTRPEIIKLSPVIRLCQSMKIPFSIIHTNQHYSSNMDQMFFDELHLPQPNFNLNIHETLHGKMVGKMLENIEEILIKLNPGIVLVQGDTNTVLAGALSAAKLQIPVGHIEAGLRSYDRSMPEEINRVVTDHVSTFLFCPTNKQKEILKLEGMAESMIVVSGNTIVDAIMQGLELSEKKEEYEHYKHEKYMLLTLHRPSNVDNHVVFSEIIEGLINVSKEFKCPIYFPVHPRTKKALEMAHIELPKQYIHQLEPVSYLEMLALQKNAVCILTDSGGIQEEACILKVPCVTIRENTERPETVDVGGNVVAGTSKEGILESVKSMSNKPRTWINPFGGGDASKIIVEKCEI